MKKIGLVILILLVVAASLFSLAAKEKFNRTGYIDLDNAKLVSIYESADNVGAGTILSANYTVPKGKTLYITIINFEIYPYQASQYDHQMRFNAYAYIPATGDVFGVAGEHANISLVTPARIESGQTVRLRMISYTPFAASMVVHALGYLE